MHGTTSHPAGAQCVTRTTLSTVLSAASVEADGKLKSIFLICFYDSFVKKHVTFP